MNNFDCTARLVQHHGQETYNISLNYMIRGNFGLVHINGHSGINSEKIFNRKISFKLQRKDDIYYFISEKNIRLPDDNFSNETLSLYVPLFFISPKKDIYMRIMKENNNYVFMVDSIPTYICNTMSK